VEQYRGFMQGWKHSADGTVRRYLDALRFLEQATGKPFLSDLSNRLNHHDVVGAIVANPGYAPESNAILVKAAKSWEKAGEFLGWWKANGILELSYGVPAHDPDPPLSQKQVDILWHSCRTAREWRLVAIGLYAGPSVGDIERMDAPCWLDDEPLGPRLVYRRKKTGRKVEVPLHPRLASLKDVILNDSGLGEGTLKQTAQRLRKRTGFHWVPGSLRRTFSQRLLDAEVPVHVVKNLMGHAPREVLFSHYATVPYGQKEAAIGTLDYGG
jgi:integrase